MPARKYCPACNANVFVGAQDICPMCKQAVVDSAAQAPRRPANGVAATQTPAASPPAPQAKGELGYAQSWQAPEQESGGTHTPTVLVPEAPIGASAPAGPAAASKQSRRAAKGRKGARVVATLIILVISLAIAGGLLYVFALPIYEESRAETDERTCFSNQRILEGAALVYAAAADLDSIEHLEGHVWENVLVPEYVPESPVCPSGSSYFMLASGEIRCESGEHAHHSQGPGGSAEVTETPTPEGEGT